MTFWAAMVLITLIVSVASVIGSVMSTRYRAKNGLSVGGMGNEVPLLKDDGAARDAMQKEVKELRDRVKVLERIVTDNRDGRSLAEQIESLRDR